MPLVRAVPVLDELLDAYSVAIGGDLQGYRGHCYRVLNFCAALAPDSGRSVEKIAIASAFHDMGIWTHRTFDYLEPSVDLAASYLAQSGDEDWIQEVALMIHEHHRVRRAPCPTGSLVEAFRRADWIDVSGGLLTFGLARQMIRQAYAIWPSAGFHRKLIQLSLDRFTAHPLSPFPMLKF